jgi:hypothetical protein
MFRGCIEIGVSVRMKQRVEQELAGCCLNVLRLLSGDERCMIVSMCLSRMSEHQ